MSGQPKFEHREAPLAKQGSLTVIGIGSFQGDDRVGWAAVDRLEQLAPKAADFRKASVPHDVLDWLNCEGTTHIIDACMDRSSSIRRFEITLDQDTGIRCGLAHPDGTFDSATPPPELRSSSSHQFDLMSTLRLAAELGRLPKQLVLWTVPIAETDANAMLTAGTELLLEACVTQLQSELLRT